jgi:hypothetical protein
LKLIFVLDFMIPAIEPPRYRAESLEILGTWSKIGIGEAYHMPCLEENKSMVMTPIPIVLVSIEEVRACWPNISQQTSTQCIWVSSVYCREITGALP